jgi:hypothetical protein
VSARRLAEHPIDVLDEPALERDRLDERRTRRKRLRQLVRLGQRRGDAGLDDGGEQVIAGREVPATRTSRRSGPREVLATSERHSR